MLPFCHLFTLVCLILGYNSDSYVVEEMQTVFIALLLLHTFFFLAFCVYAVFNVIILSRDVTTYEFIKGLSEQ